MSTVIGFTGHRPQRLRQYSSTLDKRLVDLCTAHIRHINPALDAVIVSGMALGLDTGAAKAAKHLNLNLVAMVPFTGQEVKWNDSDKKIYFELLDYATEINYTSEPPYAPWKLHHRNKAIVDTSDVILALWDGVESGGTCHCVKYAETAGKTVLNMWSSFVTYV